MGNLDIICPPDFNIGIPSVGGPTDYFLSRAAAFEAEAKALDQQARGLEPEAARWCHQEASRKREQAARALTLH